MKRKPFYHIIVKCKINAKIEIVIVMNNKRKGCKFQVTDIFYGFMVYAALGHWENNSVFSQYHKWVYYACIPIQNVLYCLYKTVLSRSKFV